MGFAFADRRPGGRRVQRRSSSFQRGQALVETLVASLALLALLVGIVAIGKLMDVRHASIGAARGLAFECAVRHAECARTDATLMNEIRRRHFMRDDREISSTAVPTTGPLLVDARPGWTDRANRPLLERLGAVNVDTPLRRLDAPMAAMRVGPGLELPGGATGLLQDVAGPSRFGLRFDGGFHAAEVRARVRPVDLQARFGLHADSVRSPTAAAPTLQFPARTAILVDGWAASGPDGGRADDLHARVSDGARLPGPLPVEPAFDVGYAGVRVLMRTADLLGLEPRAAEFAPRRLRVEIVPADRRPR